MARHDLPLIFSRSPNFASTFWLSRLAITYGSLGGLWYAHGWLVCMAAFLFYLLFSAVTFAVGSRKQVNKWARVNLEQQRREAAAQGASFDEVASWPEAIKAGERLVEQNIRHNGNL